MIGPEVPPGDRYLSIHADECVPFPVCREYFIRYYPFMRISNSASNVTSGFLTVPTSNARMFIADNNARDNPPIFICININNLSRFTPIAGSKCKASFTFCAVRSHSTSSAGTARPHGGTARCVGPPCRRRAGVFPVHGWPRAAGRDVSDMGAHGFSLFGAKTGHILHPPVYNVL